LDTSGCGVVFTFAIKTMLFTERKNMTELQKLLTTYQQASVFEREKGTYFEDLICTYLRNQTNQERGR
jgi:hypothetical protein